MAFWPKIKQFRKLLRVALDWLITCVGSLSRNANQLRQKGLSNQASPYDIAADLLLKCVKVGNPFYFEGLWWNAICWYMYSIFPHVYANVTHITISNCQLYTGVKIPPDIKMITQCSFQPSCTSPFLSKIMYVHLRLSSYRSLQLSVGLTIRTWWHICSSSHFWKRQ